ncbi:hypothetical protein [Sulfurimonas sp. HSL3-7]|uniref:hypothetical protein n=1 Tax=Sulfonitrofixus jiaomeiensis TaxID=3131938 RepID=UPI0031F78306
MIRRTFLQGSAAAVAAMCIPLSAAGFGIGSTKKKIAVVSEAAYETGYVNAVSTKVDDVVVLGSDRLKNLHILSAAMKENRGTLFCGLLVHSDFTLLHHVAAAHKAKIVSEAAHTPSHNGTSHTENSFASISVKKAFDTFSSIANGQYGTALSSYHTLGPHNTLSVAKQIDFVSNHTTKNAFVSFVIKA